MRTTTLPLPKPTARPESRLPTPGPSTSLPPTKSLPPTNGSAALALERSSFEHELPLNDPNASFVAPAHALAQAAAKGKMPPALAPGHERFLIELARLDATLREVSDGGSSEASLQKLVTSEARNTCFHVEALFRGHRKAGMGLKKARAQIKALEDGIGHYGDAVILSKWATEDRAGLAERVGPKKADRAIEAFRHREKRLHQQLRHLLERDWLLTPKQLDHSKASPGVRALARESLELDLPEAGPADAALLRELIGSACDEIAQGARQLDFNQPDAVHKLRRLLRWLALSAQSLDGAVSTRPEPGNLPARAIEPEVLAVAQKYSQALRTPRYPAPLTVPHDLYVRLNVLVAEFDFLKRKSERVENIEKALLGIERFDELATEHDQAKAEKRALEALGVKGMRLHELAVALSGYSADDLQRAEARADLKRDEICALVLSVKDSLR